MLNGADLQVDVCSYTSPNIEQVNGMEIAQQAELFIGYRKSATNWVENDSKPQYPLRADLTVASSSNPLFPDYQLHCSNGFLFVDTFDYTENGETQHLTHACVSYYVTAFECFQQAIRGDGPIDRSDPKRPSQELEYDFTQRFHRVVGRNQRLDELARSRRGCLPRRNICATIQHMLLLG